MVFLLFLFGAYLEVAAYLEAIGIEPNSRSHVRD